MIPCSTSSQSLIMFNVIILIPFANSFIECLQGKIIGDTAFKYLENLDKYCTLTGKGKFENVHGNL